jgi:hypothetical protein
MTNWTKIAEARGLELSEAELARVAAPLEAMEVVFRPLIARLGPEVDPAPVFRAAEEPE